ncbi:MAG: tetratricopeptide repeat protein [Undibacterium sp.]|nr:tetratricopeptide repeat protein [Undibacterium sp.]
MSLLMQALKKAEHTKQKQSGVTVDEALSLSPIERKSESTGAEPVTSGKPDNPGMPISALALSPHIDDTTNQQHPAAPDHATLPIAATEASSENFALHQPESWVSHDLDKTNKEIATDIVNQSTEGADRSEAINKDLTHKDLTHQDEQKNKLGQKQAAVASEIPIGIEQKKARSVFSSKIPQGSNRKLSRVVIGLLVLAMPLAIGYLYWQNMRTGIDQVLLGPQTRTVPSPQLPSVAPGPVPTEPESAAVADASAASQANISPAAPSAATSGTSIPALKSVANTGSPAAVANEIHTAPMEALASAKQAEMMPKTRNTAVVAALDMSNIQIRQSSRGNQVNPALSSAYQFFIAGDTASARQQYQKVLQQEPNNRDALLGLAALALNQRQAEQAGAFYGKLLELDPGDPDAIAGLTSLQQGDPVQSESRLKKALNQHPQAGALLFALGNLYAQQSRWTDAQQAYFRAYAAAPANADYVFNLAVSLDKLNQGKLAKEYYQRALSIGQSGSVNFSRAAVQKRVSELDSTGD